MNRRWIVLSALIFATIPVGCTTPGASRLTTQVSPGKWFAWAKPKSKKSEAEEAADNPFVVEAKTNGVLDDGSSSKNTDEATLLISDSQPVLDPEVEQMLATEFPNMTLAERNQWVKDLSGVAPQHAKAMLRLVRSRNADNQIPSSSDTGKQYVDSHHPLRDSRQRGFGQSPWDNDRQQEQQAISLTGGIETGEEQDVPRRNEPFDRMRHDDLRAPSPLDDARNRNDLFAQQDPRARRSDSPQQSMLVNSTSDSIDAANDVRIQSASYRNNAGLSEWESDLQRVISKAESEFVKLAPGGTEAERLDYTAKQVYLRMLYLMNNQQERSLRVIEDIDTEDQEFWQQMFWAMSNYFDDERIPDAGYRTAQTVDQLTTAIQKLREKAPLEIHNVNFSNDIYSYGSYELFDRDVFRPGDQVLIYAEVKNQKSEQMNDGRFRTRLKSRVEIYKAGMGPKSGLVAQIDFDAQDDISRNRRIDYFNGYRLQMPSDLTIGPYKLKLIVEDELSEKMGEYQIDFSIE